MTVQALQHPALDLSADTGTAGLERDWRCRIVNWEQANQLALIAASRAHAATGVDLSQPRVDVVAAISNARLELVWRPMPKVFGVYFNEPEANIGILVNSSLHAGARRHTAAHELGHHCLAHTTSIDDGSTIDLGTDAERHQTPRGTVDFLPSTRPRRWTDQEKA
ncbi:MAG: ImmA/IrrE family metallo-endopeptidase, partial [Nocardioides sp.]